MTWPSSKLDFKHLKKFRTSKKVSSYTYKLELPVSIKVHLVFDIFLLEPASSDPLLDQLQPPLLLIIIDEKPKWEVDEIVNSKFMDKTLKYLG